LAWKIEFAPHVEKTLRKIDRQDAHRILGYLRERVNGQTNPRLVGRPLKGEDPELWRYRVGDYRVICELRDEALIVLVVKVGHRREVYR